MGVDRVTLTLRASAAAARAGELHRAVSLSRSALGELGQDSDSELAARVRYTLAGNLMSVDSLTAAFAYSSEALVMIREDPPSRTWVWAAATHVMAARYIGESDTALKVARRALEVAEELRATDAQADLLISLAGLDGGGRRSPEGRERLLKARELAARSGNAAVELRALFNLAMGCYENGDLEECVPWLTEGLDRARRAGLLSSPYPLEMRYLRLLVLQVLGRWDECVRAAAADAEVLPAAGGYTVGPALYVALARGDVAAADRARALLEGPFDWMATLVSGIVLTDAAALRGDPEDAVRWMRSTVTALTDEAGTRPYVTVRLAALALSAVADAAAALRMAGDEAGARPWTDTATELVELARTMAAYGEHGTPQGPEGQAWLARAEAEWVRAASGPDAVAAWAKAVTAFGYGDVYERARCRLRYAEALVAAGHREEAAAEAREVRETAGLLGASPLREQVDTLIRRGRLSDRPGGDAGAAVLTAREQEVLRLLALGHSNRRIGEELFISGKTASVHVSNILAKLGASSRGEAVAIAYREGLITPEPTTSG